MSKGFRDKAWQFLEKAKSQIQRGKYTDAFAIIAKAEQLARKAKAQDVLSAVYETKATILQIWFMEMVNFTVMVNSRKRIRFLSKKLHKSIVL